MTKFNRRDLMVGAGGLVTSLLVRRSVAEVGGSSIPPAPVARVAVVKDTYFGETLSDPYRWMENDKDPDWLPFLKGQNDARARRARRDARARRPAGSACSSSPATPP